VGRGGAGLRTIPVRRRLRVHVTVRDLTRRAP
jgi:hypothetical protein